MYDSKRDPHFTLTSWRGMLTPGGVTRWSDTTPQMKLGSSNDGCKV